ncbi:MAG: hypothetical protein ACWGMZ_10980, partial [Thermoguttaceae bacterium]
MKNRLGYVFLAFIVVSITLAIRYFGGGPEKVAAAPAQKTASSSGSTLAISSAKQSPAVLKNVGANRAATPAKASVYNSTATPPPEIVAKVNGQKISRDELGRECLVHYGKEVLEEMVNRLLIEAECSRRQISVSGREIDAEIERLSSHFGLPVDQWLKLLKQERDISPDQ